MNKNRTISIKCDRQQKSSKKILETIERETSIPRGMMYLVSQGKVLNDMKTTEENNIDWNVFENNRRDGNRRADGNNRDRRGHRKERRGPSDDAMFLRKGIINAIHRSDEKWKVTQRRQMKRWTLVYKQSRTQSETSCVARTQQSRKCKKKVLTGTNGSTKESRDMEKKYSM